jgi:Ca-activated chloride channel family protein
MRFQLLLVLFLVATLGCSDAEKATMVQPHAGSVGTSATAGAPASQAESPAQVSAAQVPSAEIADWLSAARSGSLILRPRGGLPVLPGPVLDSEIRVSVTGLMARVKVRQRFVNPTDSWVEGIYVFPLPDDAAVDQMRILTDGRVIEGKIQEKEQARKTYEAAKKEGRRAGLVEQERPNVFTTSIANIRPGSEVTIEIEYQQSVRLDNGEFSLRVPTIVAPRYMPGQTEAETMPPPTLHSFEIDVDLVPGFDLDRLESPYHPIVIFDDGHAYGVSLAEGPIRADRDFVLQWWPAPGLAPEAAVFSETLGDYSYALIMVTPPFIEAAAHTGLRRDVVFVIDTSGSMVGGSLTQAKSAVVFALERLDSQDLFNVIEFNDQTASLFSESRVASSSNIQEALDFVAGLESGGGTNIALAIRRALEDQVDSTRALRQVVFLTDGGIGNETQLLDELKLRVHESRIFSIGIGRAPNSYFMRKLAQLGRGSFTHIGDPAEVAEKMTTLFRKLESAVATDIEIEFSGGRELEMYPYKVPDLYLGEPVLVAVRLDEPFRAATVTGWTGETPWRVEVDERDVLEREGIHVVWARQAIEERMHDRLAAGDVQLLTQLRAEVVELALEHHLVSTYTSLVAVDVTPERYRDETLAPHLMGAKLPSSWQADAEFGLAQGATPAGLQLLFGLLLVASSWALRRATS